MWRSKMRKKIIIVVLLILIFIIMLFINLKSKEEKGKAGAINDVIKDGEILEDEDDIDEIEVNEKEQILNESDDTENSSESDINNSNVIKSNNYSNSTNNSSSSSNIESNKSSNDTINESDSSTSTNNGSQASTSKTEDKTIDTSHPEYYIHKGRIDCTNSSDCMDKSLPIQFKYKKVISNAYYVEVAARDSTVLGYFIQYVFKEYTYSSNEECNKQGSEIKSTLSEIVTSYSCDSGTLKITTDY
jgi:hypothetical protein